jgi:hypothetical protein
MFLVNLYGCSKYLAYRMSIPNPTVKILEPVAYRRNNFFKTFFHSLTFGIEFAQIRDQLGFTRETPPDLFLFGSTENTLSDFHYSINALDRYGIPRQIAEILEKHIIGEI